MKPLKTLTVLVALLLPYSANADMLTGGTFLQFDFGLNSHIAPSFTMKPTAGFRLWNTVKGFNFGLEGVAFTNNLSFDSTTTSGWGAAAYWKVRSFDVGSVGSLHVMAKGATTSPGTWSFSLDENQHEIGPVFLYQPGARKEKPSGWGSELGLFWQSADGYVSHLGVQTRIVVDFE